MTKRNCFVTDVGNAIEKLADALDPDRSKPFGGEILDLLEWAAKDTLAMRQQLETERMRLAACGVVALSNTPESAAKARDMLPEYRSASCDDVAAAVDREMALRQQLAAALAACKLKDEALASYVTVTTPSGKVTASISTLSTIANEALSIQPDDAALKVWLGEPVGYEVTTMDGKKILMRSVCNLIGHSSEPLFAPKGRK